MCVDAANCGGTCSECARVRRWRDVITHALDRMEQDNAQNKILTKYAATFRALAEAEKETDK